MSEKLIIRNFGPIKEVNLDLKKVNVLIGEQASGKSTVLKVLAVCRYFSFIVNYKEFGKSIADQGEFNVNEQFYQGLVYWGLEEYLKVDSEISYQNELYHFYTKSFKLDLDQDPRILSVKTKLENCNDEFIKLLQDLSNLRNDELITSKKFNPDFDELSWTPNENFYRLNVRKVLNKPFYLPTERAIQTNSFKGLKIPEAIIDELIYLAYIIERFEGCEIPHLALSYKKIDGTGHVKKESDGENDYYSLQNGASGFQASIPIVMSLIHFKFDKRRRTFFVEEPELNLFPKAQKKLIDFLIDHVNGKGHSLFLTTHSPYILSSLNNLLVAYRVGQKYKDKVITGLEIDENYWLNPKMISAYSLEYDAGRGGIVQKDLFLKELQEISIDYLDGASSEINGIWDKLIAIENGD